MKRRVFFILAIVFAIIAAGSLYLYLKNIYQVSIPQLKPLVVANSTIPARSLIKAEQLVTKDVPLQGYPQGGYENIQDVAGTVALVELETGDPILEAMVQSSPSKDGAQPAVKGSLAVPDGKRALSIPIGLVSGVGYAVRPGDYVDVLTTMDIKESGTDNTQITITTLAAQDVLVLSTGDTSIVAADTEDVKPSESKYYTLAVSVPQALAVTLGSEKGSLRLLLRNPVNKEIREDPFISPAVFLDTAFYQKYR